MFFDALHLEVLVFIHVWLLFSVSAEPNNGHEVFEDGVSYADNSSFIQPRLQDAGERPSVPFPELMSMGGAYGSRERSDFSVSDPSVKSVSKIPSLEELGRSIIMLRNLCYKFSPVIQRFCIPGRTPKKFLSKCQGYFQDCFRFIGPNDPLYGLVGAFSSGAFEDWESGFSSISSRPFNQEVSTSTERYSGVDVDISDGRFSDRDYRSQSATHRTSLYDGIYETRQEESVPLALSFRNEENHDAQVSDPAGQIDLNKPVAVHVGGAARPYYQQNEHIDGDWYKGDVAHTFWVGMPFKGVVSGASINFPSAPDFCQ